MNHRNHWDLKFLFQDDADEVHPGHRGHPGSLALATLP